MAVRHGTLDSGQHHHSHSTSIFIINISSNLTTNKNHGFWESIPLKDCYDSIHSLVQGERRIDSGERLAAAPVQERRHCGLDIWSCGQPSNCTCGLTLRRLNPRVQERVRLLKCSLTSTSPRADTPPLVEGLRPERSMGPWALLYLLYTTKHFLCP